MKRNSSNQQQSQFKTRFGNFDGDYMNEFVTPDGSLVSYQVLYNWKSSWRILGFIFALFEQTKFFFFNFFFNFVLFLSFFFLNH